MIVAFDTSVIVPALAPPLPAHARAHAWVRAAMAGRFRGIMSLHAFAEAWAVLSRLPIRPAPTPGAARESLASLRRSIRCLPADARAYEDAVDRCVERGLRSGAVFDALHVVVAERARADAIVTADVAQFERLADPGRVRVVACDDAPDVLAMLARR